MIYRIIAFVLISFCTNVSAQGLPPKAQAIFNQTMAANGYLTQEMHNEFWAELRRFGTPQEIVLLSKSLNVSILDAHEYQKEFWKSAKISYENNSVVKTQRLIELETEMPIKFEDSIAFPKDSTNYEQAMSAYKRQMKISMANSKLLLDAAAKRSSMTSAQGQHIPINMQMINTVLANLTSSFTRLQNLFNENWNSK